MKLFACIILYLILIVYSEKQDFMDNDISPEDSLSGSKNHPYGNYTYICIYNIYMYINCQIEIIILIYTYKQVGIPIGTWKITDLNETKKQDVCTRQKSFCSVKS